jgi:hypothetical protein
MTLEASITIVAASQYSKNITIVNDASRGIIHILDRVIN